MPAIVVAILGALGRQLLDKLSYFVAMKALMIALVVTVLPVIIKNSMTWLIETTHNAMAQAVSGYSLEAQIIQLSGVLAYLASVFQLPSCMSIIVTALAIRLILNFVPFVG